MKPLKSVNRENKRYLLIVGRDANKNSVDDAILEFIGVLGYSNAMPKVIKTGNGKIILSVNREAVDRVRTSFFLSAKDISIKRISGSIGKLKV
jgi:RNase P/RNase MRP subunit POP5